MYARKRFQMTTRLIVEVGVLVFLVTGVAYAALVSQQDNLTGNTIQTATANLQISKDGNNFADTLPGFDFNNLIPGGQPVPTTGYPIYLRNAGATPLTLKFWVSSLPTNLNNVDLSKVNVLISTVGATGTAQIVPLQSLLSATGANATTITSGNLGVGAIQQYKLQVSMSADAVNGSSANIGNIDFAFSGTAVSN